MRSLSWIASLALVACSASAVEPAKKKPNVLFIVVDDLKPLLGCYGVSWIKSPNIDRLASRGTLFTASYCQVPFCAPSRMSVLTGLRPDSTRVFFNPAQPQDILRLRFPELVTLPQQFRNHGYTTHPLHKVFDGRTVDAGHDRASWSLPYGPWEMAPGEKPAAGGYQDPSTKARIIEAATRGNVAVGPATESCDITDQGYHDGGVALTAAKRIREFSQQSQPFFLAVGFVKPHLPFIAPQRYWDLYDRASIPLALSKQLPLGTSHDLAFYSDSGELRSYSNVPKTGAIPEPLQRELLHGYAACVSYIDAQVGRLIDTLEQVGIAEQTIVCIWGDHGWHLGEHGHWGKVTNYEDATRAPLIIAGPGEKPTPLVSSLVEFLDIYPTLCDLAGIPIPPHIDGKSLVPLLRGQNIHLHEAAISQMSPGPGKDSLMGWTLRTPRYRYIEWRHADLSSETPQVTDQVESTELYDYQLDPLELKNLASQPEHLAAVSEHQKLFDSLLPHLPRPAR